MKKERKRLILILAIMCPIVYAVCSGLSLALVAVPYTPHDAMMFAEEAANRPGTPLRWQCPDQNRGCTYEELDLGLTQADFERSMQRDVLRTTTVFAPSYAVLVDPDDICVRKVAEHITEATEGYSDELRALAALHFVQTAICYATDPELYGCDDFPALPLETLYLKKGDCEDTSILLMSIYLAMGYDAVFLDYSGHCAVGVRWEGQKGYLLCETTSPSASKLGRYGLCCNGEPPQIYRIEDIPDSARGFHSAVAWYRNAIERTTGL